MNKSVIWSPSETRTASSLLHRFVEKREFKNYEQIHEWSCNQNEEFWSEFWDFSKMIGDKGTVVKSVPVENDPYQFENTRFFVDSKINVAENMLRRSGDAIAITFCDEMGVQRQLTFDELRKHVSSFSQFLQSNGVIKGDRVAGYIPNIPEAVIAMIATASIGAIWTACSPDFGVQSVLDRFNQTEPKILITSSGYQYAGKYINLENRVREICDLTPSIEMVVLVNNNTDNIISNLTCSFMSYVQILNDFSRETLQFERFDFNIPMLILYSSGTTGVPKSIVHGAGGTLITHMKEHQLQCDIKEGDVVFYYTTCGWMMWNWLVSALASGASIVLYDGSPFYPTPNILFEYIDQLNITYFGASAKYLSALEKNGYKPSTSLPSLRAIGSTGSPLSPESYDYVYKVLKQDVHLMSISGGTDIVSCFFIGNSFDAVRRGELQGAGLGYKIDVVEDGSMENGYYSYQFVPIGKQGELVCTLPFPSQPLFFWKDYDKDNHTLTLPAFNYHGAYFSRYANIWHHGDFIEKRQSGGYVIHGRSDAVLNPGGVRIGTSEIYRQVEQISEVLESLAIGQEWDNDIRIILFVQLKEGYFLNDDLRNNIVMQIRSQTTARHVPAMILQVSDLPRTKNGKLAEIAVRNLVHNKSNTNMAALSNPESLSEIAQLLPLLKNV